MCFAQAPLMGGTNVPLQCVCMGIKLARYYLKFLPTTSIADMRLDTGCVVTVHNTVLDIIGFVLLFIYTKVNQQSNLTLEKIDWPFSAGTGFCYFSLSDIVVSSVEKFREILWQDLFFRHAYLTHTSSSRGIPGQKLIPIWKSL